MSNNTGKVSQIIGPVVDVVFDNNENELPNIYDSLEITRDNGSKLVLECQQHIGEDTVRAIAMETTDGNTIPSATNIRLSKLLIVYAFTILKSIAVNQLM